MIITLAGNIGSGKTSVATILSEELGYELVTAGKIFREIASSMELNVLELNEIAQNDRSIDKKLDNYLKGLSHKDNIIIDSRMAWYLVESLKVYLDADLDDAVLRISQSDRNTEGDLSDTNTLKQSITNRRKHEVSRFRQLYNVDISDTENYDLVVDTSYRTVEEVVKIIKEYIGGVTSDKKSR